MSFLDERHCMVNKCWGCDLFLILLEGQTCLEIPLLFLKRGNPKVPTKAVLLAGEGRIAHRLLQLAC